MADGDSLLIGRLNSLASDLEYRYFTGFLADFS
jgi:hypothetical protein